MTKRSKEYGIKDVLDVEVRIANRQGLPEAKLKALAFANPQQRQKYMINAIADHEEVWTCWDGSELPVFDSSMNGVIHIWPHKEFAMKFHSPTIRNPQFVPIPIDDFLDEILFKNEGYPLDVAYFPVGNNAQVMMDQSEDFAASVAQEWKRTHGAINHNIAF